MNIKDIISAGWTVSVESQGISVKVSAFKSNQDIFPPVIHINSINARLLERLFKISIESRVKNAVVRMQVWCNKQNEQERLVKELVEKFLS